MCIHKYKEIQPTESMFVTDVYMVSDPTALHWTPNKVHP